MGGAEHLQVREVWHLMQLEYPRAVGSEKDSAASVKVNGSDFGTSKLKEVPAIQPPLPSCTPPMDHHASLMKTENATRLLCHHRACKLRSGAMLFHGVAH